ncbi:MAG: MoxR family ATPase [Dehalococcoidales bacterium]|nr:MoxR family ATPase [Dehalococcoidales bacterium]
MERIAETAERIVSNVERVIIGKRSEVELALIGLICQGHLLIEDVPGVGKTVLAKAFAKSIGCTFRRIQFTPDLLPSDVTGVSVYNQKTGEFTFRPGPIMAQIVLADEINRATPKTQSALLECMGERQITVDGVTYVMPMPFLVMATQNPIEYEGTFPLPEAQLDRFLMRMRLGYPRRAEELEIIARQKVAHPINSLEQVVGVDELVSMQQEIRRDVEVSPLVREYIVALTSATRQHPEVYLGASPRGSLGLFRACQARAALHGRNYAIPDDIKALAVPTLAHRLIMSPSARIRNVTAQNVVSELLETISIPGATVRA